VALGVVLDPTRAARAGDDESFDAKLSAKEARKAQILAEARAKASANAAPSASASAPVRERDGPASADFFTPAGGDPGRGGGPDAPNTAPRE